MSSYPGKKGLILALLILMPCIMKAQNPQYGSNPFTFSIPEPVEGDPNLGGFGDQFFAIDLNHDGLKDFTFRSDDKIYAYDHDGSQMWKKSVSHPQGNGGAKHAAGDIDGDGQIELLVLNASNQVLIYTGSDGTLERTLDIPYVTATQIASHLAVVNLRGKGDRDLIVQTQDILPQGGTYKYYINRSLIALDLETLPLDTLWMREQDDDLNDPVSGFGGIYEGYWGQAHGPFIAADIDNDGLDEVVGGNMVDHNGTLVTMGYPTGWVGYQNDFVDHIDAIAVGDFKPSLPGLEWIVTEEDWVGGTNNWNTAIVSSSGVSWRNEATFWLLDNETREPQNLAAGNFNTGKADAEVWVRSRLGDETESQHPWVFDNDGNLYAHYEADTSLPSGFNTNPQGGNKQGMEAIWTIDWDGGEEEYIAGTARHIEGNVGVFHADDLTPVWYTPNDFSGVQAGMLYVADVSGDAREEVIIYDKADGKIKVYWNGDANPDPGPDKWDDPLYRRVKQIWNYYSPGSYTRRDPIALGVKIYLEGAYDTLTHAMRTDLQPDYIPLTSPYSEDIRVVNTIPGDAVDWVLLQLRTSPAGPPIVSRSAFLRDDGRVISEEGDTELDLFAEKDEYFVVVRHRNHLSVMSKNPVDLSSGTNDYDFTEAVSRFYGDDAALCEAGVYGMFSGDANHNDQVQNDDINDYWKVQVGMAGYKSADFNLNGQVQNDDHNDYWKYNVGKGTQISGARGPVIVPVTIPGERAAASGHQAGVNQGIVGYHNADCNLSGIVTLADHDAVLTNLNRVSRVED